MTLIEETSFSGLAMKGPTLLTAKEVSIEVDSKGFVEVVGVNSLPCSILNSSTVVKPSSNGL